MILNIVNENEWIEVVEIKFYPVEFTDQYNDKYRFLEKDFKKPYTVGVKCRLIKFSILGGGDRRMLIRGRIFLYDNIGKIIQDLPEITD